MITVTVTPVKDLLIIEPQLFGDNRGWLVETYNVEEFARHGITETFVQDNHSSSAQGVLRGLHFQRPPFAQTKLVRCSKGRLWDVAVDMRKNSPTFKQWFGLELSAENKKMLFIPAGFAHGFYSLEDCELIYKCSNVYHPEVDSGIRWNDPEIAIQWPLLPGSTPTLSDKDTQLLTVATADIPF
ncbi:MAG: dTDP-4-dehydrorhamnose 3,5-epimerase [Candidatus Kerfeldbacteria bacterium]|nr:dTDP-4-dehydrorhamnose 3,5-epimerase [Candidatus Kerfeldbacteria bacterium]